MLRSPRNANASGGGSLRSAGCLTSRRVNRIAGDQLAFRSSEDIRLAQDWLTHHAPIADVITVVEVRHRFELCPPDCRAYALEIVRTAQGLSRPHSEPNSNLKEFHHAAA